MEDKCIQVFSSEIQVGGIAQFLSARQLYSFLTGTWKWLRTRVLNDEHRWFIGLHLFLRLGRELRIKVDSVAELRGIYLEGQYCFGGCGSKPHDFVTRELIHFNCCRRCIFFHCKRRVRPAWAIVQTVERAVDRTDVVLVARETAKWPGLIVDDLAMDNVLEEYIEDYKRRKINADTS